MSGLCLAKVFTAAQSALMLAVLAYKEVTSRVYRVNIFNVGKNFVLLLL